MRKILLFMFCFTLLLSPVADAAIGSKGLIVDHGAEEIILQKGEKKWLFVQDGFSKMPVLKGLTFYSDNTIVATVGLHSGLLRGNTVGTANLTVVNGKGDCGYVKIRVVGSKKPGSVWAVLFLFAFIFTAFFLFKKTRH